MSSRGEDLLEALAEQPGGPELLKLADTGAEIAAVGGAVRDLELGRRPRELDVVVPHGAAQLAADLATRIDQSGGSRAKVTLHERFGTAVLDWDAGRIDIAQRRAETYTAPGALPDVRPGSVEEDLARRDFTVNAIALPLGGPQRGELFCAAHALEDLHDGLLRVLHEHSFRDDPTRLLRLARYKARLGFALEPHTAELARAAVEDEVLKSVSKARLGAELRLALSEASAVAALGTMEELGLLVAMNPHLRLDLELAASAGALLPDEQASTRDSRQPRPDLLLLAALLQPMAHVLGERAEHEMSLLLSELEFTAADRDRVLRAATCAEALAGNLARVEVASELYELASSESLEGVALAGAWAGVHGRSERALHAARDWLERKRHVALLITGEDLLAAGVPEGPEIGRRLAAALCWKLDIAAEADIEGRAAAREREAELDAALRARV